jgi:hypothetical protein
VGGGQLGQRGFRVTSLVLGHAQTLPSGEPCVRLHAAVQVSRPSLLRNP